jgi:ABC-type multidrug transport system fused ATPase/permease subunit
MKKGMIAFIGMIIGLVLLLLALFGPWYTVGVNGSYMGVSMDYSMNFFLTKMDMQGTAMGQSMTRSMSYADARESGQLTGVNTDSFAVIDNIMYLTIIAILCAIIAVIGMLFFIMKNSKTMRLLGVVFSFLTFLFALIAPLYFMTTAFISENSGFWFSQNILGMDMSGQPAFAWYLMIVAAIIALIASVTMLLKKSVPEVVAEPPQTV